MTKPRLTPAQRRYLECLRDGRSLATMRDATGRTRGIWRVMHALRKAGLVTPAQREDGLRIDTITQAGRDWFAA